MALQRHSMALWHMCLLHMLLAATTASAGRLLRAGRDWGDSGDPNGYETLVNARHFEGRGSKVNRAVTPEQAEAATSSDFKGIYRYQPHKGSSVAFATVEAYPGLNPDRRKETVKSYTRTAIDSNEKQTRIDKESGAGQLPMLALGTAAGSQTFEGATALSASDSIEVNGGKVTKTTTAKSLITSYPKPLPRDGNGVSLGYTAQTAKSVAVAGLADGGIVLAQAESIAAVSQASRSSADQWQMPSSTEGDRDKRWTQGK